MLKSKCLVYHLLKTGEGVSYQLILQSSIQTLQEVLLLLLIISHFLRSISRQLNELVTILTHSHAPLLQTEKFFLLKLDHPSWNMGRPEVLFEL